MEIAICLFKKYNKYNFKRKNDNFNFNCIVLYLNTIGQIGVGLMVISFKYSLG